MKAEELELEVVKGWRAYRVTKCKRDDTYVFAGLAGMHFHQNPSPVATCRTAMRFRQWTTVEDHAAPDDRCSCGYYGLTYPDTSRTLWGARLIWADVTALGRTLICQEHNEITGFKSERYVAHHIFWPSPNDQYDELLPEDAQGPGIWATTPATLSETLPGIAERLGLELVKKPMREFI